MTWALATLTPRQRAIVRVRTFDRAWDLDDLGCRLSNRRVARRGEVVHDGTGFGSKAYREAEARFEGWRAGVVEDARAGRCDGDGDGARS